MSISTPIPLPRATPLDRAHARPGAGRRTRRLLLHAALLTVALAWLFPFVWALYTSFRPFADTAERGYVSLPGTLTLDNYARAWRDGELFGHFVNTVLIVVPSVVLVLAIASGLAFVLSRFSWRFNVGMLVFFTCGSLLPPHALATPLFHLYLAVPLPAPLGDSGSMYNQLIGVVLIHVCFQLGFCTFVLASFMKTVPTEILEAARLDGASVLRTLRSIMLPLSKPALAALAVLEATWIYNDFLWALVLTQTSARQPVTTALAGLSGEFFTDHNVIAATAILIALPTLVVFLVMRRHLARGLTLGATG